MINTKIIIIIIITIIIIIIIYIAPILFSAKCLQKISSQIYHHKRENIIGS